MLHKGCYGISIVLAFSVWTSENDSNTLRGRAFLENGEKKTVFFFFFLKKDTCERGLSDCRLFLS